jgi:WD40 repeat protein
MILREACILDQSNLQELEAMRNEIKEWEDKVKELQNLIQQQEEIVLIKEIDEEIPFDECDDQQEEDERSVYPESAANKKLPEIPTNILGLIVAPMIAERSTFDSLALTCKDIREACMAMFPPPPWPEGLIRINCGVWSVAFSPDGNLFACGGGDGRIRLFDRRTGALPPLEGHVARVYSIVFDPKSRIMVSGSGEKKCLIDLVDTFAKFSHKCILICAGDGDVRVWDLTDLEVSSTSLPTNTPQIYCLALNHDGTMLASCGDGRIRLWNMDTLQWLADIPQDTRTIESIAFSPDDRFIAAGSWDSRVSLWNLQTRTRVAVLPESKCVHSICYSPDGKYICSCSDSKDLRLWNVEDRTYSTLQGHGDSVWSVAFSPDGRRIASGSDDGTLRIFDVSTGRCTGIMNGHAPFSSVYSVAFSPCSTFVASASDDRSVEIRRAR